MERSPSFEKYRQQYGTITVPDSLQRPEHEQKFEVTPITDQWLISPERSWDEVNTIIEGRLQDLQTAFQFEKQPTNIAKQYCIERPVGGNMSRFLAYVELLDEYHLVHDEHFSIAQSAREEYETKKEEIKKVIPSQGKARKQMDELWKIHYNPLIQQNTKRADEAKRIEDLILRKAVLDIFSVEGNNTDSGDPMIINSFARLVDEAKLRFNSYQNELHENIQSRKPIDFFIDTLCEYLIHTKDGNLFNRYYYRKSPVLVKKREDCRVLNSVLDLSVNSNSEDENTSNNELRKLASSFILFLKRQVSSPTQDYIREPYPTLSLIYDLITSALYKGKPAVLQNLATVLDSNFSDLMYAPSISRQTQNLVSQWWNKVASIYSQYENKINSMIKKRIKTISSKFKISQQHSAELFSYDEYRLFSGLITFSTLAQSSVNSLLFFRSKSLLTVCQQAEKALDRKAVLLAGKTKIFIGSAPDSMTQILLQLGIEVDLFNFINSQTPEDWAVSKYEKVSSNLQQILSNPDSALILKLLYLKSLPSELKNLDKVTFENEFLRLYFMVFWDENKEVSIQTEKENDLLWDEILNNLKWFVSPRGDKFSKTRDPELAEKGIDSIAFYVDRNRPREHRLVVNFTGIEKPLEFWLDTERNLLGSDRQLYYLDMVSKQSFINMLLKRLYFITSGLSAQEQEEKIGESKYESSRVLEYRRAHYRYLTSTTTKPITMTSHGAEVHAQEIREDYGIDIYAEIRRRRALGKLKPNEYLTFVRETTPTFKGQLVLPNELTYRPELIQIAA